MIYKVTYRSEGRDVVSVTAEEYFSEKKLSAELAVLETTLHNKQIQIGHLFQDTNEDQVKVSTERKICVFQKNILAHLLKSGLEWENIEYFARSTTMK